MRAVIATTVSTVTATVILAVAKVMLLAVESLVLQTQVAIMKSFNINQQISIRNTQKQTNKRTNELNKLSNVPVRKSLFGRIERFVPVCCGGEGRAEYEPAMFS